MTLPKWKPMLALAHHKVPDAGDGPALIAEDLEDKPGDSERGRGRRRAQVRHRETVADGEREIPPSRTPQS